MTTPKTVSMQCITEKFKGDMIRFAFKPASTPPDVFGDMCNTKSNAMKQADVSHPWLAANRLLGHLWHELNSCSAVEKDEEAANKLRAQLLKAVNDKGLLNQNKGRVASGCKSR